MENKTNFCPKCGANLENLTGDFCTKCGAKVNGEVEVKKAQSPNKAMTIGIAAGSVVILSIAAFIIFGVLNKSNAGASDALTSDIDTQNDVASYDEEALNAAVQEAVQAYAESLENETKETEEVTEVIEPEEVDESGGDADSIDAAFYNKIAELEYPNPWEEFYYTDYDVLYASQPSELYHMGVKAVIGQANYGYVLTIRDPQGRGTMVDAVLVPYNGSDSILWTGTDYDDAIFFMYSSTDNASELYYVLVQIGDITEYSGIDLTGHYPISYEQEL